MLTLLHYGPLCEGGTKYTSFRLGAPPDHYISLVWNTGLQIGGVMNVPKLA